MRIETFEGLINVGAGRQSSSPKSPPSPSRKPLGTIVKDRHDNIQKLFGSKETSENKKSSSEENVALEIKTIDQSLKFEDIDYDFIKLIYFPDEVSASEYISTIERIVKEYDFANITNGQN